MDEYFPPAIFAPKSERYILFRYDKIILMWCV